MGGWMDYQRVRNRNGLGQRKPLSDSDPYYRGVGEVTGPVNKWALVGDLNRMERDYLQPVYPKPPWATRPENSDPASVVASETGIDVETVRKVLFHVFGWHKDPPPA